MGPIPLTVWMRSRKSSRSGGGHKAVKDMGVFAHDQVGQELDGLAGGGELVKGGEGNEDLVADAVDFHRDLGGKGVNEFALQKSNHRDGSREARSSGGQVMRVHPGCGNANEGQFRRRPARC